MYTNGIPFMIITSRAIYFDKTEMSIGWKKDKSMTSLEWNYLCKPWKRFKIHHIKANRQFKSISNNTTGHNEHVPIISKACSCSSPVTVWEKSSLGSTILLAEYSRTSSNRRTKYLDVAKDAGERSIMAKKNPHRKRRLKKQQNFWFLYSVTRNTRSDIKPSSHPFLRE